MEKDGVWIPVTPGKFPVSLGLNSVYTIDGQHNCKTALTSGEVNGNKNINEGFSFNATGYLESNGSSNMYAFKAVSHEHDMNLGVNPKDPRSTEPVQYNTSHVQVDPVKLPHGIRESPAGNGSVPFPSGMKNSRKRRNNGIDLNKKPSQRRRMKKHRPKVYDDSKPKKTPKAPKTPKTPKTPKPRTPNRVQERRKLARKNTITESNDTFMQASSGYSYVQKDIVQDFIQSASMNSIIDVNKSCKRFLDFDNNLVDKESTLVLSSHVILPRSDDTHSELFDFGRIVTSKRNTLRKSRFPHKLLEASTLLGDDDNKLQCQQERRFVNFYRRRKKISTNNVTLRVYSRKFRPNECVQNSKKSGPNFPSIFKKRRRRRSKRLVIWNWWVSKPIEEDKSHVKISQRNPIQASRKRVRGTVNKSEVTSHVKISQRKPIQASRKRVHDTVIKSEVKFLNPCFITKQKRSIRNIRIRENIMDLAIVEPVPYDDGNFPLNQEENFLNIKPMEYDNGKSFIIQEEVMAYDGGKCLLNQEENFMNIIKLMDNDSGKCLLNQEENILEIRERVPPVEDVPVQPTECFESQHVDISFDAMNAMQLHEVQVDESPSLVGSQSLVVSQSLVGSQSLVVSQSFVGNQCLLPRNHISFARKEPNGLNFRESFELLIRKMKNLELNDDQCKEIVVRKNNVSELQLVTMDPKKQKKLKAKVDIDDETLRVWKLLMENDGSEPVEEMDKDKEEWWERQRKIFHGRVDSFIAKMHLIQGNRRFTQWKGSVTDSVVGVYLTQNVSDHLSSSAFLKLAAKYPVKSKSKNVDDSGEFPNRQESVGSNKGFDGGFSMNNNEKESRTSCADVGDDTIPTTQEDSVIDPFLVQDVNGNPNSFRKLLEIEEVDFLRQFYNSGNDDADLNASKEQPRNSQSFDLSSSHEEGNSNDFQKFLGIENMDFYSLQNDESAVLNENRDNGDFNATETSSSILQTSQESISDERLNHSAIIVHEKTAPEEEVIPICTPNSEVTFEQIADSVKSQQSVKETTGKKKSKAQEKKEVKKIDWEELRRTYCNNGRERNEKNMDAVDWDAVRRAPHKEIADTIVERGMNNVIAARIKEFLQRMVEDHGSLDLEWLRDVPPDMAKDFLLSITGLGLKSVECVRLLTLQHLAFPVDTNVARVATRLGWVPLQPLPENLQIHLLKEYPMMDTIQKYLFPRLCTLDQRTLYELHYQLITFGKVFCTKISPNCNACPMRAECRHYASAFASARLALPGSKESKVTSIITATTELNDPTVDNTPPEPAQLPPPPFFDLKVNNMGTSYDAQSTDPIIEVPLSPDPYTEEETLPIIKDIEDYFCESDDEIPTIRLSSEDFRESLKDTLYVNSVSLPEADVSKALVALTAQESYIPAPRMKYIAKLRTVHYVYEIPDFHPILSGFEVREEDDPTPYLLAIWIPGQNSDPLENSENRACSSSNNGLEETVKGSVLIPCRTATRGKFPLNGTYFQVNEVFADDETSRIPMDIPRSQLWNLSRRYLGCGTSATSIFKGLSTADIQRCFWKGSICVRGFNRETRHPGPLHRRFHISTTAVALDKKLGKQ